MAGIGVEDQLGVSQMLEHEIRVAVGKHCAVAPAHDEDRLADPPQDLVLGIFGSTPASYRFGLLAQDRFPALG